MLKVRGRLSGPRNARRIKIKNDKDLIVFTSDDFGHQFHVAKKGNVQFHL